MSPQSSIAHYRITSKLGEGGMGAVYRATDTKLNRDVAIKIIPEVFAEDADRMARFTREAQVLASLNHPNIAAIYGVEERALVLELVEGPTLAGPMSVDSALPIARQIAEALEYAHEKGVIHRDLKPANIKLTQEGRVKVLDFGLAKALATEISASDPASSPTLTMRATTAGVIMGTAAYMSPEQARGAPTDKRADIWSFGVVFYEMLTGHQIFGGDTVSDSLAAVLKTDPDWSALPAETPPAIGRLLKRCLVRDRKQRLPDIAVARMEIDEAMSGGWQVEAPAPVKFRWWDAMLALVALGGLAVTIAHFREAPPVAAPVRFEIAAPAKTGAGNFGGMALSPDGRKLAFIAAGTTGRPTLWVRAMDSVTAQSLPGTEGAAFLPFWSPDSRYVGFLVAGKIKSIAVGASNASGLPQTLCEMSGGPLVGASWSRDGVIIFGSATTGLFRVSQSGGVAIPVTKLDNAQGELGHLRPWFLPDGRHFLYYSRNIRPSEAGIFVGSLDGKVRKRLLSASQAGAYAPPAAGSEFGHLLFLRESTLMAQPLDQKRWELTGEPFPVAEQVGASLAMGFFAVSSNGVIAYRSGRSTGSAQLVWFDRDGKSLGPLGQLAFGDFVSISPDGKHVAMDQVDGTGNRDIWILDAARGVPTRFTFDPAQDLNPVWSPDGTRLAFGTDRNSASYDTYQKSSNGSGSEELLIKSGRPEHWSPDGRYILYNLLDPQNGYDLWVAPVGQGDAKPVPYLQTKFDERQGQFSPDGRWVAYSSNDSGDATQYQVYVQSFPIGGGKFRISTDGGVQPRWGRDGKELFYIGPDGKLMAVNVKTSPRFEAGLPKALFDPMILGGGGQFALSRYDVAPDGKRFLVASSANTEAGSPAPEPITVVINWNAGRNH